MFIYILSHRNNICCIQILLEPVSNVVGDMIWNCWPFSGVPCRTARGASRCLLMSADVDVKLPICTCKPYSWLPQLMSQQVTLGGNDWMNSFCLVGTTDYHRSTPQSTKEHRSQETYNYGMAHAPSIFCPFCFPKKKVIEGPSSSPKAQQPIAPRDSRPWFGPSAVAACSSGLLSACQLPGGARAGFCLLLCATETTREKTRQQKQFDTKT